MFNQHVRVILLNSPFPHRTCQIMHPVYRPSLPPPPSRKEEILHNHCLWTTTIPWRNWIQLLCKIFFFRGGGGVNEVLYGLCENGDSTHERETIRWRMECNAVHWLVLVFGIKREIGKKKKKILHTWFYYSTLQKILIEKINEKDATVIVLFLVSTSPWGSPPAPLFLDQTEARIVSFAALLGERCVTSKKRLRGRLKPEGPKKSFLETGPPSPI